MSEVRNSKLQALCRDYLKKLRPFASKFGLGEFVDETISANLRKECESTEHECEMLARMCDDERIQRIDIPKVLGKSYRQCNENEDFDRVRKLKHVGIYSKISALLLGEEMKNENGNDRDKT